MQQDFITFTITSIRQETKLVKVFELHPESPIDYKAGQYLTFVVNDRGNEVRRSYSLASSPVLNEPLSIGLKKIPNGVFSRSLFDHAQMGDKLYSPGPGGVFVLPDEPEETGSYFFLLQVQELYPFTL